MIKTQLSEDSIEQNDRINHLKEIVLQDPNNWRNNLFSGVKYAQMGLYPPAKELFQANIDNGHDIRLHARLIGDALISAKDMDSFDALCNRMINEKVFRNQDIIHFLGKVPDSRILEKIKEQIFGIKIKLSPSLFGKDSILVTLPDKWLIQDPDNFRMSVLLDESRISPTNVSLDEDSSCYILGFDDILDMKSLRKEGVSPPLTLELNHPSGKVSIEGRFEIIEEKENKNITDKGFDLAKKYSSMLKKKVFSEDEDSKKEIDKEQRENFKVVKHPKFFIEKVLFNENSYSISDGNKLVKLVDSK